MSEENLSEFEQQLIENIISQFKPSDEKQVDAVSQEDTSKITYNDYYKSQGINYIKRNIKLNDPLLDPVFELMAQNIKTPLEEWNERYPKQNKKSKNKVEFHEINCYL
jgi:hypothetical protein